MLLKQLGRAAGGFVLRLVHGAKFFWRERALGCGGILRRPPFQLIRSKRETLGIFARPSLVVFERHVDEGFTTADSRELMQCTGEVLRRFLLRGGDDAVTAVFFGRFDIPRLANKSARHRDVALDPAAVGAWPDDRPQTGKSNKHSNGAGERSHSS